MSDFDPLESLIEEPAAPPVEPAELAEPTTPVAEPTEPAVSEPAAPQAPTADETPFDVSVIPEEHRSHVERILQEAEAAKAWAPYAELGVNEVDPEGLAALLQFAEDITDPEKARDALLGIAGALEIDLADPEAAALDPDAPDAPDPDDPVAALQARLDAIEQEREQTKEQEQVRGLQQQALTAYQAEFAEVETLNGKPFSQDEKVQLIGLAKRFQLDHDEPIKAAFDFIGSISGRAEKALVESQPTPPAPAEPAGRASSSVQPVDSFEDALRIHIDRNTQA